MTRPDFVPDARIAPEPAFAPEARAVPQPRNLPEPRIAPEPRVASAPEPAVAVEPAPVPQPEAVPPSRPQAAAPTAARALNPRFFAGRVPAQQAAAPPAPVAPRVRTCLVVDDSRVVRKVSRRIVEGLGYAVIEAENGGEALERCRHAMPDLILLDWDMPVMTGIEFIRQLRDASGGTVPKTVFCTARKESLDIHQGIDAGAAEYVSKPFDEASLTAKLKRIGAA